jgi:hypothetical protein
VHEGEDADGEAGGDQGMGNVCPGSENASRNSLGIPGKECRCPRNDTTVPGSIFAP